MISQKVIDPSTLDKKTVYTLLTTSVIPRPIAFVTSKTDDDTINAAPFSYFNVVSAKPALLSVTVGKRDNRDKDTARNIKKHKEFVVHSVTEDNIEQVNKTSKTLSPHDSEIDLTNLTLVDSHAIKTPGIKESAVRFECELYQIVPLYDGATISGEMFIGTIKNIIINDDVLTNNSIDAQKLKPIARLGGNDYATLGKIFTLKRPK